MWNWQLSVLLIAFPVMACRKVCCEELTSVRSTWHSKRHSKCKCSDHKPTFFFSYRQDGGVYVEARSEKETQAGENIYSKHTNLMHSTVWILVNTVYKTTRNITNIVPKRKIQPVIVCSTRSSLIMSHLLLSFHSRSLLQNPLRYCNEPNILELMMCLLVCWSVCVVTSVGF